MNPVRKSLVTIFPAVLLAGSPVGLAGNCSITNGVAVGE
jgi:hypothetical protein